MPLHVFKIPNLANYVILNIQNAGKPECEIIVSINITIQKGVIVLREEITKEIIMANTIIPKDGTKQAKILNTLDKEITLQKL